MHAGDCLSAFPSLPKPQSPGAVVQEPVLSRQVVLRARAEPGPGLVASGHPTSRHHKQSSASSPNIRWSERESSANPGLWEPGNSTTVPTSLLSGERLASAMRCRARGRSQTFPPPCGGRSGDCEGQRQVLLPWGPELPYLCLCSRVVCPPASAPCLQQEPSPQKAMSRVSRRSQRWGMPQEPGTRAVTHIHICRCASPLGTRGWTPQPHQGSNPAWGWVFPACRVLPLDVGPLQSPHLRAWSPSLPWFVPAASPVPSACPAPQRGAGCAPAHPCPPSAARCTGG